MSEWTRVEDGLPDSDETVMIATPTGSEPVWLGYHDGEMWRAAAGYPIRVTHWMPMPEPPVLVMAEQVIGEPQ